MIDAVLVAALVAGAMPDACAPVEPAGAPDPRAAAAYRAVGDEERAAGRRDSATVAYRAAVSRDATDAASRAELAGLCRQEQRDGAFERGLRLMRSGDCAGAHAAFEEARATGDRAAALLEGICLYQLGEDGRASALLREAEADPATQDSARFFLGLVALRDGRDDEAAALLESSAADRRLAPLAHDLSRAARRAGRLVFSFVAESGWDSNVDLAPDGSPAPSSSADGSAGATAALSFAPHGESGPFASASATWRDQLRFDAFDMRAAGVAAGWQVGHGLRRALFEYAYDYRDLGGAPYLSAHRLLAAGRVDLARAWSVGATYSARFESFLAAPSSEYSGLRHAGEVELSLLLGKGWDLGAAWRGGRDSARESSLSWWEHGPRVSLRKALSPRARIGVEAAWTWRSYGGVDQGFQAARADEYADASALAEVDLSARFTLRVAVAARRALSNASDYRYTKVVPTLGLAYTFGVL